MVICVFFDLLCFEKIGSWSGFAVWQQTAPLYKPDFKKNEMPEYSGGMGGNMSQNLFKNLIYQYKGLIDDCFGIIADDFHVATCSDDSLNNEDFSYLEDMIDENDNVIYDRGFAFKPVFVRGKVEFILFIQNTEPNSIRLLNILSIAFLNIKQLQEEKVNKANYIKLLLQDSVLPSDIYVKAKELKIATDIERVVYVIKVDADYGEAVYDIMVTLFPQKNKDFIVSLDEQTIVLVKELKSTDDNATINKIAELIKNTINAEAFARAKIGVGSEVQTVREIATSFREAKIAIEVGKVFENEKDIINYENLGIGRLIYQLPTTLCKKFLDEVFKKGSLEHLDNDTVFTIQKFFENSLNISETARKLYVHRNTLVYRLDKIQKNTGLDLRHFDDAIIFKIAMMVKKYLSANVIKM